jgi:hypothetical protein
MTAIVVDVLMCGGKASMRRGCPQPKHLRGVASESGMGLQTIIISSTSAADPTFIIRGNRHRLFFPSARRDSQLDIGCRGAAQDVDKGLQSDLPGTIRRDALSADSTAPDLPPPTLTLPPP